MPTSFKDILEAFEFVGMSGSLGENLAFLCRRTGKIYWHSEFSDVAELDDELPDDVDDEEKYIAIPDKLELDLGKPLALVIRRKALDRWYEFESKATERALRDWCALNSIAVVD